MPPSQSKLTPRKTTNDLSVLVNADRIRSSIKRLFHNNIAEVLSELFQNCQRSGAKNVQITITPDGCSITDDGHGLLGGIGGFHTLLKLAESAFDNPTIADQDPMGVGIVSLMTHDKVEEITFSSGKKSKRNVKHEYPENANGTKLAPSLNSDLNTEEPQSDQASMKQNHQLQITQFSDRDSPCS